MKRRKPGKTLIVGYGNPLRSDDGFGWHVTRGLVQALAGCEVEVMSCRQLTPEIAEPLSRCQFAIFLDADSRGTPGKLHCRTVHPASPTVEALTHRCTPAYLLASAEKLYGSRPRAVTLTVSAQTFAFGEKLSPVVSAALAGAVKRVRYLVGAAQTSLRERSLIPESESRPLAAIRRLPQIKKGGDRYGQRRCKKRQDR
jgi:hydrogenase maturation protease